MELGSLGAPPATFKSGNPHFLPSLSFPAQAHWDPGWEPLSAAAPRGPLAVVQKPRQATAPKPRFIPQLPQGRGGRHKRQRRRQRLRENEEGETKGRERLRDRGGGREREEGERQREERLRDKEGGRETEGGERLRDRRRERDRGRRRERLRDREDSETEGAGEQWREAAAEVGRARGQEAAMAVPPPSLTIICWQSLHERRSPAFSRVRAASASSTARWPGEDRKERGRWRQARRIAVARSRCPGQASASPCLAF